jgi:16S rRNA processing protein RimM
VGLVRRPHGRGGELSIEIVTDFPGRFVPGARLFWRARGTIRPVTIAGARPHGDRVLLRFEEVGPQDAAALAGGELCVPPEEAVSPPPDYHYGHAIRGWNCEDPSGAPLGTVAALEQTAAGSLLTVRTPDGREVLVPFVRPIVRAIETDRKRIVLDPPEGLWDL